MMLAVVRIRGSVGVRRKFEDAMKMLRLNEQNTCVVVPEDESYRGMIEKVKDFVTFGKIDLETFLAMLKKRGRLEGNRRLDEKTVKETGYESVEQMAKDIFEGKANMKRIPKLKPIFRLTPPSGGFKSAKEHYPKGDLGNRKEAINDLLKRMT